MSDDRLTDDGAGATDAGAREGEEGPDGARDGEGGAADDEPRTDVARERTGDARGESGTYPFTDRDGRAMETEVDQASSREGDGAADAAVDAQAGDRHGATSGAGTDSLTDGSSRPEAGDAERGGTDGRRPQADGAGGADEDGGGTATGSDRASATVDGHPPSSGGGGSDWSEAGSTTEPRTGDAAEHTSEAVADSGSRAVRSEAVERTGTDEDQQAGTSAPSPDATAPSSQADLPPETEPEGQDESAPTEAPRGTDDAYGVDSGPRSGAFDLDVEEAVLEETGPSGGLFDDLLSGEPIFENKEVLRPSYTPDELPHRDDQISDMATILVAALRGETPSNILIYGKTGTGKTASAKFVSQELEETSQRYDVPCEVEYINCEVTDTKYRVLAQLANEFIEKNEAHVEERIADLESLREAVRSGRRSLEGTPFASLEDVTARIESRQADRASWETVPMTGWPTDRVYSTFFEAVDYQERVVVIMLDEIDKLVEKSGDDTLYNLSRMNSELESSRVSIMGISNDLKFTDFLDPRVKSSLGEEEIVFPPYDANQLRDILQHRADVAFKADVLSEDVIPLCAAFAAQEHGDARRALDLLRTAGELAEREGSDIVLEKHVRQAQEKIELDRVVEVVRTLPTQSKLVLFAIITLEEHDVRNINTGEVYNVYKQLCQDIDADVLTQRRVTDLISELDMLGIVNAVVVSKGRYGRTKEISLSVPVEETEGVLLSDSRLVEFENTKPYVQSRFDN